MNPVYIQRALKKSMSSLPPNFRFGDDWESIKFPEGYEKPPKEVFEAKLQEIIDAQPWEELREERNKRLTECDWVTLRSVATDTPIPDEWKAYMQALRDLPANTADPENPTWPEAPN
jgi:hypothetical protein